MQMKSLGDFDLDSATGFHHHRLLSFYSIANIAIISDPNEVMVFLTRLLHSYKPTNPKVLLMVIGHHIVNSDMI